MGPIVDRSKEHLGTSDRAIIAMRKGLLEAADTVERGGEPGAADPRDYADVRLTDVIVDERVDWADALSEGVLR